MAYVGAVQTPIQRLSWRAPMVVEIPRGKRRLVIAAAEVGPTRGLPPALFYHDLLSCSPEASHR